MYVANVYIFLRVDNSFVNSKYFINMLFFEEFIVSWYKDMVEILDHVLTGSMLQTKLVGWYVEYAQS